MGYPTSDSPAGAQSNWDVWSTYGVLVVAEAEALEPARALVDGLTDAVGLAASRFRTDSEISRLNTAGGLPVEISPLFAELVATALRMAEVTGGLVDPMVGTALVALGYDRDIAELRAGGAGPVVTVSGTTTWRDVELDPAAGTLRIPAGAVLDLGATAKAWTSDRAAERIWDELGVPALVGLGGDIAVAGVPAGNPGFVVRIVEHPDEPDGPLLAVPQGGLATSSTRVRRWQAGRREVHHVIDPRTALPAREVWRTVSVVASTCVEANAATTGALVLGDGAVEWLRGHGLPARLVAQDGSVVRLGTWPREV